MGGKNADSFKPNESSDGEVIS